MTSSPPPNATLTTYRNPVLPGWNAQPSVCNVPGKGYFVATSSASFVPAVPVYHSTDLFTWELVGHAIHETPGGHRGLDYDSPPGSSNSSSMSLSNCSGSAGMSSATSATTASSSISGSSSASGSGTRSAPGKNRNYHPRSGGYWSPCIRYHGGRWYVVVTHECEDGQPRLLITSTRDIFDTYSWTTPVAVTFHGREPLYGRDPELFFDAGKVYLLYTGTYWQTDECRVYMTQIDPDTGVTSGLMKTLYIGDHTAARLLKCAGWYYLLLDNEVTDKVTLPRTIVQPTPPAENMSFQQSCTRVFRTKGHPFDGGFIDTYEICPHNPVLFNNDHPNVRGTSRLSLVRGERGWTAIFNAVRGDLVQAKGSFVPHFVPLPLGQETYMSNATWKDGWPVINDGLPIGVTGDAEGMRWLPEVDEFEDSFKCELSYSWSSWNATLATSPDTNLTLGPTEAYAEDAEMVLRQPNVSVNFETELDMTSLRASKGKAALAGLVVRVGDKSAKFGIRAGEVVHEVNGQQTSYPLAPSTSPVSKLRIFARPDAYEFRLAGDDTPAGSLRVSLQLTPGCHGAMMGMFSAGEARFLRAGWKKIE